MVKIVILCHGFKGHGNYLWFKPLSKDLEEIGVRCISPDLPDPQDPLYPPWRDVLQDVVDKNWQGNELYFVGHSMGGYLVLRFLAEAAGQPFLKQVRGVMLVGSTSMKNPARRRMYDAEIEWESLSTANWQWFVVWSRDDPLVSEEHALLICEKLKDAKYCCVDGCGHFCTHEVAEIIQKTAFTMIEG